MNVIVKGLVAFCIALVPCSLGGALPESCSQAVVGVTDGWNSSHVQLTMLEKKDGRWTPVKGPFPGRLGKSGTIWGLGLTLPPKNAKVKTEGDLRSPVGVFALGGVYGTVDTPQKHRSLPYRKVTPADLWVEDPNSPQYNHHIILKKPASTKWELEQQMKLNDYPHSLKIFIKHNAPGDPGRPIARAGSSIFFHIWRRDGQAPTAGCTTMSEADIRALIRWLDPTKKPVYILLPKNEYLKLRKIWGLP